MAILSQSLVGIRRRLTSHLFQQTIPGENGGEWRIVRRLLVAAAAAAALAVADSV